MIDAAFGYWLSGLTDGEGCFTGHKGNQNGHYYQFQITLREDDAPVLNYIQATLGVGKVYHCSQAKARAAGIKRRDYVRFEVNRQEDVRDTIIPFFDAFPLRSKKNKDYLEWRSAFMSKPYRPTRAKGVCDESKVQEVKEISSIQTTPGR